MLDDIKRTRMRFLQSGIDTKRLLVIPTVLEEFSLNIQQGFIIRANSQCLCHITLQIYIVLIVDAEIHGRRQDVVIGRIVGYRLVKHLYSASIIPRLRTGFYQIYEHRLAILVLTRMDVSLEIRNCLLITVCIHQISRSKIRQLRKGWRSRIPFTREIGHRCHINISLGKQDGICLSPLAAAIGSRIRKIRDYVSHVVKSLSVSSTCLCRFFQHSIICCIATVKSIIHSSLVTTLIGKADEFLV